MAGSDGPGNNYGYQFTAGSMPAEWQTGLTYTHMKTLDHTNWDEADTFAIYQLIYQQHDGPYNEAAVAWYELMYQLEGVKAQMTSAAQKLAGGWDPAKNDAASAFFRQIGASTWSIQDWTDTASRNGDAASAIAQAINKARSDIKDLWAGFKKDYIEPKAQRDSVGTNPYDPTGNALAKLGSDISNGVSDGIGWLWDHATGQKTTLGDIKNDYDNRARKIAQTLADAYLQAYIKAGQGYTFQGPLKVVDPATALKSRTPDLQALAQHQAAAAASKAAAAAAAAKQKQQQLEQQLKQQEQAKQKQMQQQLIAAQKNAQAQLDQLQQQKLAQQQKAQQALAEMLAHPPTTMTMPVGPVGPAISALAVGPNAARLTRGGPNLAALREEEQARLAALENTALAEGGGGGSGGGNLLGRPGLGGLSEGLPGGGGPGGMGNPGLRGRAGGPGGMGEPGAPGRGSPLGRRQGREPDRPGMPASPIRPESEEYLGAPPAGAGPMAARLAGALPPEGGSTPPPGAGLPGRSGLPGQRGGPGGPPGQPGVPGSNRNRQVQPGDLAGRRKRDLVGETEDELLLLPSLNRPNLVGRKGMPAADAEGVAGPEIGAERAMLGARGAPMAPEPPEKLTGRRTEKSEKGEPADTSAVESTSAPDGTGAAHELWTVDAPDTIERPTEAAVDPQRGKALGTN